MKLGPWYIRHSWALIYLFLTFVAISANVTNVHIDDPLSLQCGTHVSVCGVWFLTSVTAALNRPSADIPTLISVQKPRRLKPDHQCDLGQAGKSKSASCQQTLPNAEWNKTIAPRVPHHSPYSYMHNLSRTFDPNFWCGPDDFSRTVMDEQCLGVMH